MHQLIKAAQVRNIAGGPGISGAKGVLYQTEDETPSRIYFWDGEKHVAADGTSAVARSDSPMRPDAPTGVVALAADGAVLVYFDRVPGATSYRAVGVGAGLPISVTAADSPILVPGMVNGVLCSVRVAAANAWSEGDLSAAVSVTPRALPGALAGLLGVMAWWDVSQMPAQGDGTSVVSMPDASGNGFGLAQADGSLRPVYRTNWLATGKPGLDFDGSGDNLVSTLTQENLGSDATVFLVFSLKSLTAVSGARDQRIISGETRRFDKGFCVTTSDANVGGGGNSYICVKGGTPEVNAGAAFGAVAINTKYLVSVVIGSQHFINGTRQAPGYAGIAQLLPRKNGIAIGNVPNNADDQSASMVFAQALIFRGRLTDAQRWVVEAYLASFYGMAAPAQQVTV